jgi:hypothetical protein
LDGYAGSQRRAKGVDIIHKKAACQHLLVLAVAKSNDALINSERAEFNPVQKAHLFPQFFEKMQSIRRNYKSKNPYFCRPFLLSSVG